MEYNPRLTTGNIRYVTAAIAFAPLFRFFPLMRLCVCVCVCRASTFLLSVHEYIDCGWRWNSPVFFRSYHYFNFSASKWNIHTLWVSQQPENQYTYLFICYIEGRQSSCLHICQYTQKNKQYTFGLAALLVLIEYPLVEISHGIEI